MIKQVEQHENKVVVTFESKDEALVYAPAIHAILLGGNMVHDVAIGKAKAQDIRQVDADTNEPLAKASSYVEAMIGRVLVKPDDFKYGGRIVIPDKHQRRPTVGTIVQVNLPGLDGNPNNFAVGDRIVYGVYSGTPVLLTIDQVETPLIVLTPEEVLVRLHGKTDLKEAGQGY